VGFRDIAINPVGDIRQILEIEAELLVANRIFLALKLEMHICFP
jgi:hypothetical protein